ncbi:hypothetical protein SU32_12000 [Ahrensia marina]|uniref:Uncharacterized protein n=1 Tax=Ahrensia marina TaxID=1514904 RepID=A0A0N0VLJ0_9HYPH|nr:hypothetical protein SU32_12000 [Ahrensia marina]
MYELRPSVSERPEPDEGDRGSQENDGRAARIKGNRNLLFARPRSVAAAGVACTELKKMMVERRV